MKKDKLNINYQIKSNQATYKEIDESQRIIKAVVNTYDYFDYDSDVLRKGSAINSITQRGSKSAAPDKILHALNHNLNVLPGKSMNEAEASIGGKSVLYAESYLPETQKGNDLLAEYKAGIYNQHSIGFRYTEIDYVEKGTNEWDKYLKNLINPEDAIKIGFGWDVKGIDWMEWSTVAFGANKLTQYLGTKSLNKYDQLSSIYAKLDKFVLAAKTTKNSGIFDAQYFQIKQMISEITDIENVTDEKEEAKKRNQKIKERKLKLMLI